ncbi:MAG: Pyruvate synthase subunit PorA [bacterium ADurb.Bin236]|nr:MAG: Pyruvate synthase subunit PorA [bacterium ADurb.Bin236]HPN94365.1 thiamine pyrophosphate-dependent enzyme [bacterium]
MASGAMKNEASEKYEQISVVDSGNEMAAAAASQINYHVMGYYPITPSTQIPEEMDRLKANGYNTINMVPGDGEHGAAGICFGAAAAGGRVFNATSAQGLLFALEQLPVQSGTRLPMVLNLVNRAVSGPLNIRGDHSDLASCLNIGWVILMAPDPQAVYDMNICAVRVGEHPDVRLPVIVSQDGFFTSHQKRRVRVFKNDEAVREFIGPFKPDYDLLDPTNPITVGPYMNDDLINNRKQQSDAMIRAYDVIPKIFEEYAAISGRKYELVTTYRMEDAEAALFMLNSSSSTARAAIDGLRSEGKKVGLVTANVIRPFPIREIQAVFKNCKAICVADRQDTFGGWGGMMTIEIKAALKDDPENKSLIFSRIYGLGGLEFYISDAVKLLNEALEAAQTGKVAKPYEYVGAFEGETGFKPELVAPPLDIAALTPGIISVSPDPETGKLQVKGVNSRELTRMPKRLAPGHGACPGCGIIPSLNLFMRGIEGPVVTLFHTGCGMIIGTGYPNSAHRQTYVHNLFQNGAPTVAGIVEMYHEKKRRGELPSDLDITFIMVTGDGGNDIGMGPTIGSALRNNNMICLEYDNGGYMNTGHQLSFSTPLGHETTTSHVGPAQHGKKTHHKDTVQIMNACHIPYVFTGAECNHLDLTRKAAKAQYMAREHGFVYGKIFSACPLNWRIPENKCREIIQAGVDCCFFPLYEIENGVTTLTYDPEEKNKRIPALDWLKMMGKTKHLAKPAFENELKSFEAEVERRWQRIKAMSEHPLL